MNRALPKKLALATASTVVCIVAVLAGLKLYASWLGIRDPSFHYENQLSLWQPEAEIGFVNKPNFAAYCFGNVAVRTNQLGFRSTREVSANPLPQTRRWVGMGDSVMWGTSVQEEDSFLGMLAPRLQKHGRYEVINAGVVGFSTYQERLFLEKHVLPLKPDVVLVNYCINDYLPSEDPFGNVREIHVRYLRRRLEEDRPALTSAERSGLEELMRVFQSADHVWSALQSASSGMRELMLKELVERPMVEMAALCRQRGVRLIWLLIPPRVQDASYAQVMRRLQKTLRDERGEYLDLSPLLIPNHEEIPDLTVVSPSRFGWLRQLLQNRDLDHIALLRRMEAIHRANLYLDEFHPTKKGNRIIAEAIERAWASGDRSLEGS